MQSFNVLIVLSVLVGSVFASSNFGDSCSGIHLAGSGSGLQIAAVCANIGGGNNGEQLLGLSSCLLNNNGEFGCQANGGAMASCDGCRLEGTTLSCNCFRANGGTDITSIDLNSCIGNNDGVLTCP